MKYFDTAMPGLAIAALITVSSPLAAQWVNVGKLLTPRSEVSAVKLKDGRILVAGGQRNYGSYTGPLQDSETFTWAKGPKAVSPMNQARFSHTLTLLPDGKVLATGGSYADSRYCYFMAPELATAEIFNPTTGTWQSTDSMSFRRANHAAIALKNGTVLIVGERREVECYNPVTHTFTVIANLNYIRINPKLIPLEDGRVLVLGIGQADDPEAARTAEIFNPENNTFQLTQPMTQERAMRFTATRLQDGRVLIAGGDTDTAHVGTYEVFNPSTGLFTFLGRLSTDREHHTATLMRDGSVLLIGGNGITNRVPEGAVGCMPPITGPLTLVERVFPNAMKVEEVEYLDKGYQGHASFLRKNGLFGSVLVLGGECTNDPLATSSKELEVTSDGMTSSVFAESVSARRDSLKANEKLFPGQSIQDAAQTFKLQLQQDGNLVYLSRNKVLWASNTHGKNVKHLVLQNDGNLVLYGYDNKAIWASNTPGKIDNSYILKILNGTSGTLAITRDNAIWSSQTNISGLLEVDDPNNNECVLAGFENSLIPQTLNDIETGMSSRNFRSSDNKQFRLEFGIDGNLVLYKIGPGTSKEALWSSKTFNAEQGGVRTTITEAVVSSDGQFSIMARKTDENTYTFWDECIWSVRGSSSVSENSNVRLKVQNDGNLVLYNDKTIKVLY